MNEKRFVVRTVRNGLVKVYGVYYKPDNPEYDGSLEGLRYAFGRYWLGDREYRASDGKRILCLWGTEHDFTIGDDRDFAAEPHCVDGVFLYDWWHEID